MPWKAEEKKDEKILRYFIVFLNYVKANRILGMIFYIKNPTVYLYDT